MARFSKSITRFIPHLLLTIAVLYTSLFFLDKQEFINADLGRHLKTGQMVFDHPEILTTNSYSYTEPDYPVINHHWLSGVIFYRVQNRFGFEGLTVLSYVVYTSAILLASFARPGRPIHTRLLALLIVMPLVVYRNQVRPEMFSYFGIALFLFSLERFRTTRQLKYLFPLPVYLFFWANTHLYFIFGLALIALYFIDSLINRQTKDVLVLFRLGLTSLAVCLLNPSGFHLLLTPFTIMKDYGYTVLENQSVMTFLSVIFYANYYHFLVLLILTAALLYRHFSLDFFKRNLIAVTLLTVGAYLGWSMIRNIVLFGLFWLVFGMDLLEASFSKTGLRRLAAPAIGAATILATIAPADYYHLDWSHFGFGLRPGVNEAADFFKTHRLSGPIFNNYNIGSYLIYHLYPADRVFVDNRPEAYPPAFFSDVYVAMQTREAVWLQMEQKYHFQTIIYDYHDNGVWKADFLKRRSLDPTWKMVYRDYLGAVIFSKQNQDAR